MYRFLLAALVAAASLASFASTSAGKPAKGPRPRSAAPSTPAPPAPPAGQSTPAPPATPSAPATPGPAGAPPASSGAGDHHGRGKGHGNGEDNGDGNGHGHGHGRGNGNGNGNGNGPGDGSVPGSTAPPALPPASAPVAGSSVTLAPGSGTVSVQLPHTDAFLALAQASELPLGTVINATQGTVALTSAVSAAGAVKTGTFTGSAFVVHQSGGAHPLTDLALTGGSFAACTRISPPVHGGMLPVMMARRAASHRVIRQLWGSDSGGRFVTIGRTASASVRGTVWLTQDRCDGTLIRVFKGAVLVDDKVLHRHVLVRAGHAYLARALA